MRNTNSLIAAAMLAISCSPALAQPRPEVTLSVGLQNVVEYQDDVIPAQYATNAGITPSVMPKNFFTVNVIGDIVSVNGQPAKGTYIGRTRALIASPTPNPGGAIADITRTALREHIFEFQQSDGTPVGTIMSLGFSGGPAPPGLPSAERGNWAIVGGTGAYAGASGEVGGMGGAGRAASMSEDPAKRRINGGTSFPFTVHLAPRSFPQILTSPGGFLVTHSNDFSLVNATRPAAPNELLSVFVSGLGQTTPPLATGELFPSAPLATVNVPVSVTVNGENAQVLAAVGYPGADTAYQVNFRVPADVPSGPAKLQITTAWISSATTAIPVQAAN